MRNFLKSVKRWLFEPVVLSEWDKAGLVILFIVFLIEVFCAAAVYLSGR